MQELSRATIMNLSAGSTVYARGIQLFKNSAVKSISVQRITGQIKISIIDSFEYTVNIDEKEDTEIVYTCNCADFVKEKGACRHVVAGLFAVLKHQEHERMKALPTPEDRRACALMDAFRGQDDIVRAELVYHVEPVITVTRMLGTSESAAYLSLKCGHERLYKIQNLKKFVSDYLQKNDIVLGKEFKFIYFESEFDRSSQEILGFISEALDMLGLEEGGNTSRVFERSRMMLTQSLLLRLIKTIGKGTFTLNLYDTTYENVRVFEQNPNIKYDLDVVDDAIMLDYRDKEAVIPLSKNGELIYYNGAVFIPDARFKRNYAPFFNNLGFDKPALIFRGENKQRFLEEVLPKIGDSMDIDIPDELADRYISPDFKCSIYFDRYVNGIKAEVHYIYGDFEFNSFENPKSDFYIIIRNAAAEESVLSELEELGFEARSGFYLLKNESSIYDFLTGDRSSLSAKADLFYSEEFKKLKIVSGKGFNIGLRVSSDMDLLEMDFGYSDMGPEELQSLFRSLRVRKKYYRLQDGSFIDLTNKDFENLMDIFDNLGISSKNIGANGIKLVKSNAFYLEDAFAECGFNVKKSDDFVRLIDNIRNARQENFEIPEGINAQLRGYQEVGYRWLMTLAHNSLGGILADDMGLGKTLQTIVYIEEEKHRSDSAKHFLIVCPSSIIYNWMDEVNNFAPDISVCVVTGVPEDRHKIIESYEKYDVLITSYPLMRRDVSVYRKFVFDTVFLDEAQFIKNAASMNAQSVKQLRAQHRFALTGTPIENSLSELWSIFDFIMPNFLMAHSRFVQKYEKPIIAGDEKALGSLNMRIRPFVMRRMKKDVLKELPGKLEEKMVTPLNDEQKKLYISYVSSIRSDLFEEIEEKGIEKSQIKILAALTRLRQICCHPSTFLDDYQGGSGKLDLLLQQLDNAIANGHRTLVFSQFTSMLDIIRKELDAREIGYFYLDGQTLPKERLDMAKRFNNGEGTIFLISLKAGGTGLNLVGADTVIHYDPWWNPAVEDQATDRAYRIGQTSNVYVLKLLTKGTIEEKIYKLQQKKKELSDSVIQSKEVFISSLTKEELESIFTFDGL